jgi:hypothetical protein
LTDFVVYHKPERMGYDAIEVDKLSIYTDKAPQNAAGGRVWLLTGEGSPRKYLLRAAFVIEQVGTSDKPDFRTCISGKAGHLFHPMPVLNDELWFSAFRKSQGNFAFGFQPIGRKDAVAGLTKLLSAATL